MSGLAAVNQLQGINAGIFLQHVLGRFNKFFRLPAIANNSGFNAVDDILAFFQIFFKLITGQLGI
ncbi:hypothetical protein EFR42_08365 [Lactobacillus delbrueckii]|nr:hypothetical protein [Lactobacillus delbrueckii]MCT3492503.1 hypothetical protein [Lactobacillus delbrueckii]